MKKQKKESEKTMALENSDLEKTYKSVKNFRRLGNGRDYRKVIVGNTDDARTSTFTCVGHISQNWPSWKRISIKGDNLTKLFYTVSQTIDGKRAHIFLWNELTGNLWNLQNERQKLLVWFETAKPQDCTAMTELIVERTGSDYKVLRYPVRKAQSSTN